MAYLRWGSSKWYVYACVNNYTSKDMQILMVCDIESFHYEELKEDLKACLDRCVLTYESQSKKVCAPSDIEELKLAMEEFISDTEEDPELTAIEKLKNTKHKDLPLIINLHRSELYKECLRLRFDGKDIPEELYLGL